MVTAKVFFPLSQGLIGVCDYGDWTDLIKGRSVHAWKDPSRKYLDVYYVRQNIRRNGKYTCRYLHRAIMKPKGSYHVDHISGDTLDNTRENLRVISHQENLLNRQTRKKRWSQLPGVTKQDGKWTAQWEQKRIGYFISEKDAWIAYKEIAIKNGMREEFLNSFGRTV